MTQIIMRDPRELQMLQPFLGLLDHHDKQFIDICKSIKNDGFDGAKPMVELMDRLFLLEATQPALFQ